MRIKSNTFEKVRLTIYILSIIIAIVVLFTGYEGNCYWRENYKIICPTCGFTRATISFMKLDFKNAITYNAFYTCILLPFILYLVINDIFVVIQRWIWLRWRRRVRRITKKDEISYVEIILGGASMQHSKKKII